MENCFIYDWLTVSFKNDVDVDCLIHVLGLTSIPWEFQETGSRLKYGHRIAYDGISIHYTDPDDIRHNEGCCLEMSGQGCRDFETFGKGDWWVLFEFIRLTGGTITRLDIAYDDFSGVLPLRTIFDMADRWYFTARSQKLRLMKESPDSDPAHAGLSVCHGSKSSEVYVRIYDKRVERHAWDEMQHWVRFEIQLRGSCCLGFVRAPGGLGEKFRSVVAQYINYKCPDLDDSNRRRWVVAPFWQKFLDSAAALSVHQTRDVEYNKDRLDSHIYKRNHNSIKAEILADGLSSFLEKVFEHPEPLPDKYKHVLEASPREKEARQILGLSCSGSQILAVTDDIETFLDAHGINPLRVAK